MDRETIVETRMVAALFLIAFGILTAFFGAFSQGFSITPSQSDRPIVTFFGCVLAAAGISLVILTIRNYRDDL
jgi:energy-converting hydrogenase Eha subunit E